MELNRKLVMTFKTTDDKKVSLTVDNPIEDLTEEEVKTDYEVNTGKVIIETIKERGISPLDVPGAVVKNHGPFTWGNSPENAVYNAVVMEKVAEMDLKTLSLNPQAEMKQYVLDKHYKRKHGPNAYYGQK